jgi:hypothetical protein
MSTQPCRSEDVPFAHIEWKHVRSASFLLAAVVSPILLLVLARPPLLLPLISLVSLTCAAVAAVAAWWTSSERNSARINLWDLSGAYAFTGFAAAMISEPQQVIEFWAGPADVSIPLEKLKP